ncbi:hypothetical protein F3Y22_tig00111105pilonHSYRG00600 [Hibiscus syriacus]|uniref:Uncharacterized protein n=1 Tax=Hibiscus syriacus TaxID=106335 RepID=A0A6A2YZX6_HIBSY|nr:hypothetical protein F3Y22_tig00111105pilonHSYRG00600 [Hibiscus syriacus]
MYKLEYRSRQCVFLGYNSSHKGYKCLDENGQIFVSRHVIFDETVFPYSVCKVTENHSVSPHVSNGVLPVVMVPRDHQSSVERSTSNNAHANPVHDTCGVDGHDVSSSKNADESNVVPSPGTTNISMNQLVDGVAEWYSIDSELCSHEIVPKSTVLLNDTRVPPDTTTNAHPMVTRSKSGIRKPRIYQVVCAIREPHNIKEAFMHPHWKTAAQAEYDVLVQNKTWSLVPLPANMRVVTCKWLFKVKRNADGSVARYKARLVTKGFL